MIDEKLVIVEVDMTADIDVVSVLRILRAIPDDDIFSSPLNQAVNAGFKMISAKKNDDTPGMMVYRIVHDVCLGKRFFIDHLVTKPEQRGLGIGTKLLEFVKALSKELECNHMRLCSGHARHDAHRLYEANDFECFSHKFVLQLSVG